MYVNVGVGVQQLRSTHGTDALALQNQYCYTWKLRVRRTANGWVLRESTCGLDIVCIKSVPSTVRLLSVNNDAGNALGICIAVCHAIVIDIIRHRYHSFL